METKSFFDGKYTFQNTSGNTRNGFYHKSTLLKHGYQYAEAKVNYLNRTWESYTFQTSMIRAVEDLIESAKLSIVESYKYNNNLSRVSKAKKEELYAQSAEIAELNELMNQLGH